jgi:3-oxoacyl-[acyl-carrier protein] reductase
MDLGIKGRSAIVCASSQGLGHACALALAAEGVNVIINGRDIEKLSATAEEIRKLTKVEVTPVAADINTEAGRNTLLAACKFPDILINNNAGPPPGVFEEWSHQDWISGIEANMIAPIMMIKGVIEGMEARRWGRIVNITSAMVKTPKPQMGLSTGARAGLTSLSKSLSVRVAKNNVTINNLLPERIDSPRQIYMAKKQADRENISYKEARQRIADSMAAKRMGLTEEFGAACAFFCSDKSGYISGQNLQLDGGTYPGII